MIATFRLIAGVCAAVLWAAVFASAQPVQITRGGLTVRGEIVGFDGSFLRLRRDDGAELTLRYVEAECIGALCPEVADFVPGLVIAADPALADVLLPALIEGYARGAGLRAVRREAEAVEYDVERRDTGAPVMRLRLRRGGVEHMLDGRADLWLTRQEITRDQATRAEAAGLGRLTDPAQGEILALDAIVPVVSARRALKLLSLDVLDGLMSGRLRDWADAGSVPGPVTVHRGTDAQVAEAVAADPNGIGLVRVGRGGHAREMPLGGPCGIERTASRVAVKSGDYPLVRPVFLYRPMRHSAPQVDTWLAWLRSAEAQRIIRRAGFIDRSAERLPLNAQGDRWLSAVAGADDLTALQQMLGKLDGMDRLTTTFRFRTGSTRLDTLSRANLLHLARVLRDGGWSGAELVLIGFSDGIGAAEANRTLSLARAESVRRALLEVLGGELPADTRLRIDAFGEALPLACDDTELGRQSNRRVELWVNGG